MKIYHLLLCGLAAVLYAGCSHKAANTAGPAPGVHQLNEAGEIVVPLPARTPYDNDPKARAVYLEFYALGYRLVVTSFAGAGCICESEGAVEHYVASMNGYIDGSDAGSAWVVRNRQQDQQQSSATTAAPVVPTSLGQR